MVSHLAPPSLEARLTDGRAVLDALSARVDKSGIQSNDINKTT